MEYDPAHTMAILKRLSGVWVGKGTAQFPTTGAFPYREQLTFSAGEGKPAIHYQQRTWRPGENGQEMQSHWETGFWRILADNQVEFLCVQASGVLEAARGLLTLTAGGFILDLTSSLVAQDARVQHTARKFELREGVLSYWMSMQTTAVSSLTLHVHAELRQED